MKFVLDSDQGTGIQSLNSSLLTAPVLDTGDGVWIPAPDYYLRGHA